jgi:hypothetical protein
VPIKALLKELRSVFEGAEELRKPPIKALF